MSFCWDAVVGGVIDSPANGPAPLPWDIPVDPPEKFSNRRVSMEVPHTASVTVRFSLLSFLLGYVVMCFQSIIDK